MVYDVIVIGGGPSGLMASNVFEEHNINFLLLEKNEKLGKKILLTGGKRCNVTNNLGVEEFISFLTIKHERFLYPALFEFGPKEVISFFKKRGLGLVIEDNFKYFPETHKSSSVLAALCQKLDMNKVKLENFVKLISKKDDLFKVVTNKEIFYTKRIVVATGSKSYPSIGSNGDGLLFAKSFGIEYEDFSPAETHVYSDFVAKKLSALSGISLKNINLKINKQKKTHQGSLLFTHYGLSGPAVMHASEHIYEELLINKVNVSFSLVNKNREQVEEIFNKAIEERLSVLKVLEQLMIKRLAKIVLELLKINNNKCNEIAKKDLQRIISLITFFSIKIDKVESTSKAFVNKGGIMISELNPQTFESKKVDSLFFIGETVNVHGPIGGFNITLALAMGHRCANEMITIIEGCS